MFLWFNFVKKKHIIKNTIKTEKGIFTVKYVPKHYNFEKLALDGYDNVNIFNVEYSSDFYRLGDDDKIKILFKELEPQIIQIMKFYVNENIEFYKHFDVDYTLIGNSFSYTSRELFNSYYFYLNWSRFLKTELKFESLNCLKKITEEQKHNAYGFS